MKLNDLRPLQKKTFTGAYRLTGRVACFDDDGFPYSKLRLSSCTDDIVVLERRDRLEVFLKAPASKNYHHNGPGGLLMHSLEVAKGVLNMIRINEPDMPRALQEVGFVAGLLHDIGKTFTCDVKGRPTAAARLCVHDDLTLEACAFGLAYLDKVDPQAAITLRHIWTSASPGARYGMPAAMTLARYVRDADGQSAMADNQRKAFNRRKPQGFARLGRNAYWLPSLEAH